MTTATQKLQALWFEMKRESSCADYINEMIQQLSLLGTNGDATTKQWIKEQVEKLLMELRSPGLPSKIT